MKIRITKAPNRSNKYNFGGNFSNGVVQINAGGLHSTNPNEGVLMGHDENFVPNLVEEGEVIYNDYVFSNRLRVPKEVRQKYKLRGVTFADAAKQLQKESEERPNDPISKNGLEASMQMLTNEQEMIRAKKNRNRYANGGHLFDWGGNKLNIYGYDSSYNAGNWFVNNQYTDDYLKRVDAMTLNDWNLHLRDQANFYNDEKNKGTARYNVIDYMYKANPWMKDYVATEGDLGKMRKLAKSKPGFMHPLEVLQRLLEEEKVLEVPAPQEDKAPPAAPVVVKKDEEVPVKKVDPMKNHWLRYAPIVGSGLSVFNDLLGGNEPDYSNANMYQRAIEGTNRPIRSRPIGNYLTYKPFDRDYYINKLNADATAGRRAVANTSGGNRAAAMAGILASDYNYGNQLGALARQAEEYNLAQRQAVEEFNRGTNTTNAEMGLKVDMANANQAMLRAGMYGSLAEYRDKILAANRAEKSANLTNFIQGLGNLGTELTDKDKLRWLAELGVLKYDVSGNYTGGKETESKETKKANGGRINRKKRGGFTI